MKAKYLFFAALFTMGLFASCTPESLENENTEQQVKGIPPVPTNAG